MKINYKIISLFALASVAYTATAQKAKVVSAYNYNKSYERDKDCSELAKGIKAINEASQSESTSKYPKTWYYGANLYFNTLLSENDPKCEVKFENSLDKAYEYCLNTIKYNIEGDGAKSLDITKEEDFEKLAGFIKNRETEYKEASYTRDVLHQKIPLIAQRFTNDGVEAFNAKDFEKCKAYSLKSYALNSLRNVTDTASLYNAALAAGQLGNDDETIKLYDKLIALQYGGADMFVYKANIYHEKGELDKKMEVIRAGLEVYPNDANLNNEQLDYLLKSGKTEEAMANFDKAIAADPENAALWYNRGFVNDQMKNIEAAEKDYSKALELNPEFFDAAYNLGAMYYNLGVEWNNKAANYGIDENDKYEEASKKATDFFSKARPWLESAHSLNEEDPSTITSLVQIYATQGEEEKYAAMKAKLK